MNKAIVIGICLLLIGVIVYVGFIKKSAPTAVVETDTVSAELTQLKRDKSHGTATTE